MSSPTLLHNLFYKSLYILVICLLLPSRLEARQTTVDSIRANPGRAGGIYLAYPVTHDSQVRFTPPPKGYEPFYVSHYGRHGSRYLISDNDYLKVVRILDDAEKNGALTPLGLELKAKLDTIYTEACGLGGELTPLGVRQHTDIARRLIKNNPQIFKGSPRVTANSTVVMRCAHSMFAFCNALTKEAPWLDISMGSAPRTMSYLNYHSEESNAHSGHNGLWYRPWQKFKAEKTTPGRLVASIFSDPHYIESSIDPAEFMWDLYWITVDLQNMETPIRLYTLFTDQELFDLWQVFNFNFYACNSSYPYADGTITDNAKNLVRNILETARAYIASGENGATLRFGHDGNIIPLTALLQLDDCYAFVGDPRQLASHYADYSISPMAANLQIIFYRTSKPSRNTGDILVKFLLNEKEIAFGGGTVPTAFPSSPYYRWSDVENKLTEILETPSRHYLPEKYRNANRYIERP